MRRKTESCRRWSIGISVFNDYRSAACVPIFILQGMGKTRKCAGQNVGAGMTARKTCQTRGVNSDVARLLKSDLGISHPPLAGFGTPAGGHARPYNRPDGTNGRRYPHR